MLSSLREAEACNRAAAAVKIFVTKPSGPLIHGLGDLAQSVTGIDVLASLIELLRRLLVEAGHANDDLGNATMDYHDLGGIDDAIRLREASDCPEARSLAESLSLMLSRTEGQPGYAPEEIPPSTPEDTSWIEACSRIGQRTPHLALDESGASLNFAGRAETLWPRAGTVRP